MTQPYHTWVWYDPRPPGQHPTKTLAHWCLLQLYSQWLTYGSINRGLNKENVVNRHSGFPQS